MSPIPPPSIPRRKVTALLAVLLLAGGPSAPGAAAQGPDGADMELGLHECIRAALEHNLDIAVQRYDIEISEAAIDTARSAFESTLTTQYSETDVARQNVDPFAGTLTIEQKTRFGQTEWVDPTTWGGTFDVRLQGVKQRSNITISDPSYFTGLRFQYTQSLLRNFGLEVNRAPIVIAQNDQAVSQEQFRDQVMRTVQATENAYWDLLFARKDLAVKQQSLALAEELLRMNRAKVEVGTLAPIDVTQAEAGVASREEDVIVAEARVENAEDLLRQLMNPDPDSPLWTSRLVPVDEPRFDPMAPDMEAAIDAARRSRPDLQQQRLQVESSRIQERVDEKAKRWDLNVQATYDLEGVEGRIVDPITGQVILDTDFLDAIEGLSETEFADWTLGANLVIPLGNKAARARYASSQLRREQSETRLRNLELAAEIDVRARVRDVVTNVKRVEAARKNRELQQKNVEAEQKKYENGMSTSFNVLEVQEDLASAESAENLAIIDYQKSLAALETSKGTLLDARRVQVAQALSAPLGPLSPGSYDLRGSMGGGN